MILTIAHRDTPLDEVYLRDVSTYIVEGQLLIVLFNDGRRRNYPLENIRWFGEVTQVNDAKVFQGYADPTDGFILDMLDERAQYSG